MAKKKDVEAETVCVGKECQVQVTPLPPRVNKRRVTNSICASRVHRSSRPLCDFLFRCIVLRFLQCTSEKRLPPRSCRLPYVYVYWSLVTRADCMSTTKLTMSDFTMLYGTLSSSIVISRHRAAVFLKPAPGNHAGTWRTMSSWSVSRFT